MPTLWRTASSASASRASCCRPSHSWPIRRRSIRRSRPASTRTPPTLGTSSGSTGSTTSTATGSTCPTTWCCRRELTGIESPVIVVFGDRFPMITAHKVLAAYACLAPRVITGQFDPTRHRAIWPSTGNYARGGIAISRIMASRGVAILPAGMSQERFDWLDRWCANPAEDVIKTVGTESNVKEIYDACNELAKDPDNFVLNQFSELGNHLGHYEITGRALAAVFEHVAAEPAEPPARRVHECHRIGRHDRGRRSAEGRVRLEDRRRRGARVPDDAAERLRRAQHPGHRRQAHPAHPQRDEHRRRGGHQRSGHGRARRVVQHA